jgi:hypothetical protein
LGERLLCKQEVVGSIPSGSTSGDPVGQPFKKFRPRTSRAARPKTNPRLAKRPVHGTFAMRVLSDIVKRRSFRANVAALAAVFCALLMTCLIAATIHRPMSRMFMSAKLDRLAVGSILKQEIEVFLNQCSIGTDQKSVSAIGRYISCCGSSPRIPHSERAMGGH